MTRRSLIALLVAAAALAGGVAFWQLRAPAATAVQLQPAPLLRTLQFSARVAALSRVELGSTLTGRVVEVKVREGERVRPGERLLQLESDELRAVLAQAQAGEQQAAARLAGLRSTGRSAALAGVAQAGSVLLAAQAELKRSQDLVAQGFLSPAKLDDAQRAVSVAQAQRDSARAQATAIGDQGSDVAQAQAQLALAQAATQSAHARLAQTAVTAPAAAQVLDRLVEPGQIVQPGKALLALALDGPTELLAQVDERYLEQLQVGQSAAVLADAFPGQRFTARVRSIAPLVDAQRGAVEVRFSVDAPVPAFLREDMTLSVEVDTARREQALALPMAALRSTAPTGHVAANTAAAIAPDGSATVWRVRDGRVEAVTVRLGLRTLDAAEVLSGLAAGDLVLTGAAPPPGARVRAEVAPLATVVRRARADDAGATLTNAMGR
jgi:HlyD family secretion protein